MKKLFLIVSLFFYWIGFSQIPTDSISNYLEDQLYFTFHYTNLMNMPANFNTYGFSNGFAIGFIKDVPLNKQRNIGIGVGLGYAASSFKNNLKITEENNSFIYSLHEEPFSTNKLNTKAIEIPLEFRWRTSTAEKFKFWRIYTGINFSYLLSSNYSFSDSATTYQIKNPDIVNKWTYGLILNAGYGTFNVYTYYGLKPLLKGVSINEEKVSPKTFKIGLIFYIL